MSRQESVIDSARTSAAVGLAATDGRRGRLPPADLIAVQNGSLVSAPAFRRRHVVVVVDGDPHVRTLLEVCLETSGCTVILAKDATEAIRRVARVRPDAVVTGIDLPGLDGWQLVRRLRGDPHVASVPIVVFAERAHHDTRGDNLGDVHAVDRLVGAQAVADLITILVRPAEAMTQGESLAEETSRLGMRASGGRRWDVSTDEAPQRRRLQESWIPHFG